MRVIWFIGCCVSVALGVLGIFLPLMPTVVFLLIGAYAFAQSSPRWHNWLITHETLGPPIHNWQKTGAISRRAKLFATLSIALSFGITVLLGPPGWVLGLVGAILIGVLLFIWTRPND